MVRQQSARQFPSTRGPIIELTLPSNATLQARAIAGARDERTLLPVALQAFVRCFSLAEEEICWDAQVYAQLLNLWK
jgi:hypothetical protein